MTIAVLGGGAFGTALAISLGRKGPVALWARNAAALEAERENRKRLPGHPFPENLQVVANLTDVKADTLLLALPMQQARGFLETHQSLMREKTIVACCKGVELNSGVGPIRVIEQTLPDATPAILTGPSFAADIARGLPTALTLACRDDAMGEDLQQSLTTENIRLYRTTDTVGAELGGALKNVIAIGCGAVMGAGLGESARAALMTRGFAEMQRFAIQQGAEARTLAGLAGFGDLTLTCTSQQSRNYRLGVALGRNASFDNAVTVEGAATAQAVHALALELNLDMPITAAIAGLLNKSVTIETAMQALLRRPLKEE